MKGLLAFVVLGKVEGLLSLRSFLVAKRVQIRVENHNVIDTLGPAIVHGVVEAVPFAVVNSIGVKLA